MSSSQRRAALAALDRARPAIARLDPSRNPEDLAADLIESWSAVETALRSLMGGSALGGQALIRELRQRQLLSLDEAHALVEFHAARERADRTDYRPTTADAAVARDGFARLEAGLMRDSPPLDAARRASVAAPLRAAEAPGVVVPPIPSERRPAALGRLLIGVAVLALVALGAWIALSRFGGPDRKMEEAQRAYASGQRERARGLFSEVARDNPELSAPHVYLGRIAREERNYDEARRELETAIRLDPQGALPQREMGSLLFALGNYQLARNFYVRAVERDANDRTAMGYLACSLARLGNFQGAQQFAQRAGQGPWSACLAAPFPAPGSASFPTQPVR